MNKLLETYILDELLVVLETNPLFSAFGAPIESWEITNIRTLDNHYQIHIRYNESGHATRIIEKHKIIQKLRNNKLKQLGI